MRVVRVSRDKFTGKTRPGRRDYESFRLPRNPRLFCLVKTFGTFAGDCDATMSLFIAFVAGIAVTIIAVVIYAVAVFHDMRW